MSNIKTKLIELCTEIVNDEQFIHHRNVITEFLSTKSENHPYFQLLHYQAALEEAHKAGEEITEEERQKLDDLGVAAFSCPDTQNFMDSQDALEQLEDMVVRAVQSTYEKGEAPKIDELV